MSTTVDMVARQALGAIGAVDLDGLPQAYLWVSNRYAELVAQVRYRHLRRAGATTIAAVETTGTVDLVQGSPDVVGTGTAWTSALVGRYLRARQTWYEIVDVLSPTVLTLGSAFTEADATGSGVTIVQRYVALPATVRFATSFVLGRNWTPLDSVSLRALDDLHAPGRFYSSTLGSGGGYVAHVGYDASRGGQLYEVYPYSTQPETLHYVYWATPPRLSADDPLPPTIDPYVLKEGVLIDVYRYAMGKALVAGRTDVAAFWRNELRAQETTWNGRFMPQAAKADRGADDAEWLWRTVGATGTGGPRDIRSARDHVWATGNRP